MENKKFKVINRGACETFEVDDEWLDNIPRDGIEELELVTGGENDKVIVTYSDGKMVSWENVHGTWGFPTTLE